MINKSKKNFLVKSIWASISIPLFVMLTIALITVSGYLLQIRAEQDAFTQTKTMSSAEAKGQYELFKLAAEIKQIRSDTSGSLFWLKLVAIFVTVGGAVGGYLLGQSKTTRHKIEFEQRKNVDQIYQSIILELSGEKPVLRAAAAVKLGAILKKIPIEWKIEDPERCVEIIELTKRVLAAALAIEQDVKVLKTITIELARHKPWKDNKVEKVRAEFSDIRDIDLSGVKAVDAYWAKVDFTNTDFYTANLQKTSFRKSIIINCQFRECNLKEAILSGSHCEQANFKMADLRKADFSEATLTSANFENAKVYGVILKDAIFGVIPDVVVDDSVLGDGSVMLNFKQWHAKTITS